MERGESIAAQGAVVRALSSNGAFRVVMEVTVGIIGRKLSVWFRRRPLQIQVVSPAHSFFKTTHAGRGLHREVAEVRSAADDPLRLISVRG